MDPRLSLKDGREVTLRAATEDDAFGVLLLIDAVAHERVYLLNTEAYWGVEGQRDWIRAVHRTGGAMLVAEAPEGEVVAWADLARPHALLARHTATLGTGVRADWRDVGLGRALLREITGMAHELGIEKLELHVRSTNARAIHVYESLGWQHEGVGHRSYKQDGVYEDRIQMGLWLSSA